MFLFQMILKELYVLLVKIIETKISNLYWLILLILILYMKILDQLLHMVYHPL